MHTLRIVPVALTLVAAAAAQVPIIPLPTRGMMSSFPAGVIMSPGGEIQKKAAGLPVAGVPPTLGSFTPSYYAAHPVQAIMAKLANLAIPLGVTQIAIDAISSGNDTLPLLYTASGEFWIAQANAPGWAVLYLVMEGDPALAAVGGNAVMGYYFENPSFPQQLRKGIYYELLPSDFPGASIPSGLDVAMGEIDDNRGRLIVNSTPVTDLIYFSLTPASAKLLCNELQAANALLLHTPSVPNTPPVPYTLPAPGYYTGATIFVAKFDGTGLCSDVQVCEDWQTLGIAPDSDIDALGVGPAPSVGAQNGFQCLVPNSPQYVFSLNGEPGKELLVAADVGNAPNAVRLQGSLRGNNGDVLLGGGGTLQGRVRGLCARDPEVGGLGGSADGEPVIVGDPGTAHCLSLSLAAQTTSTAGPNDQFMLTGVVSGWGGWNPEASLFWLRMEIVGGPLPGYTTYFGPWSRAATDDYQEFQQAFNVPFLDTWGLLHVNRCRFSVYQAGLSQSHVPTESFRSLMFRSL
jgi:hypothetical protein